MAEIIYEEGFEGQNNLDYIEGIEIGLGNEKKTLIYPKYARLSMIDNLNMLTDWDTEEETEQQAYASDGVAEDEELYRINSPAALFVSKYYTYHNGARCLPTLLIAQTIVDKYKEIDEQAKKIEGADLLSNFIDSRTKIWSCNRASFTCCYGANTKDFCPEMLEVFNPNLCVPCVLDYEY